MGRNLLTLGLLFVSAAAGAAPAITGTTGTVAHNGEVTINGSGFGSNSLAQEFLGGDRVDALANNARIDQQGWANWSMMTPSTATYPHVTTERGWSGGKSIAFDTRGTTEYKQTLFYDTGSSGFNFLYTNALIYLDHIDLLSGSYLQWKMMRWYKVPDVLDHAQGLSGAYMSNRVASSSFFTGFNASTQFTNWFSGNLPGRRSWYRYETWLRMNSSPGTGNGTFRVKVTNPTTGAVVADNTYNNVMFNASGDSGNFRYLVIQNYYGNASDGGYNQAANAQAVHMVVAAYLVRGFTTAAFYAWQLLKNKDVEYNRRALSLALWMALSLVPVQMAVGDWSAKVVAKTQPVKLAAMEGQFETESRAPLRIGGLPNEEARRTDYAIEIPAVLSFLAYADFNAEVRGLNEFPRENQPPIAIVHFAFQIMVGGGTIMLVAALWGGIGYLRQRTWPTSRFFLWLIIALGPLSILTLQAGWTVTEVGRQPWIVQGYMRTAEAVTDAPGVWIVFAATLGIYALIGSVAGIVLWQLGKIPIKH